MRPPDKLKKKHNTINFKHRVVDKLNKNNRSTILIFMFQIIRNMLTGIYKEAVIQIQTIIELNSSLCLFFYFLKALTKAFFGYTYLHMINVLTTL